MKEINVLGVKLQLLPEKAIYIESLRSLLVADIHLGKSETFQASGIPIPNTVNQQSLDRLQDLCSKVKPENLIILGDLFHSKFALVDEVIERWTQFLNEIDTNVKLIIGNHDRKLVQSLKNLSMNCLTDSLQINNLVLSHEPCPQSQSLNICGHVHPCIRIKTKLDDLRLPCFYFESSQNLLMLPSFGEFTGGYEVSLKPNAIAYVVVEDSIVPFEA